MKKSIARLQTAQEKRLVAPPVAKVHKDAELRQVQVPLALIATVISIPEEKPLGAKIVRSLDTLGSLHALK